MGQFLAYSNFAKTKNQDRYKCTKSIIFVHLSISIREKPDFVCWKKRTHSGIYCSPPAGLRTFWNFNKNQKTGHFHHYSHPLHNFQPYPQEDVNSETKVMVVSLLHLGKIYQADWKFSVLSSCRFLVVNFRKKFEEELEISRRQNLKGPGDINNLQLQDVQGIHYLIPKVV